MGIFGFSEDYDDCYDLPRPKEIFVLMEESLGGTFSSFDEPVGFTYNESDAKIWVEKAKNYHRKYIRVQEMEISL